MEKANEFGDLVASKCLELYDSLGKIGAKPREGAEWTLLSAFLIEKMNDDLSEIEVVSLATGTKCIGRQSMSLQGDILNDSHAEVLARRAFLRYVYSEIEKTYRNESSEIFSGFDNSRKCILRNNIKFHFYTSHVPCGDASIMPKLENKRKCESDEESVKKIKTDPCERTLVSDENSHIITDIGDIIDIYRTGAKCLPNDLRKDSKSHGPNYHTIGLVRTKPGRGDPTLSVSCSDKMARWLFAGIQGALLSILLADDQTIFLSSITVGGGGQYNKEALYRALILRSSLQETSAFIPQLIHSKHVFCHSRYLASSSSKPAPASIIWYKNIVGKRKFEVAVEGRKQGFTKKLKCRNHISICKKELFKTFLYLTKFDPSTSYQDVKEQATGYQKKVNCFKEKMGTWTMKDPKLLKFCCSAEELDKCKSVSDSIVT